MLARKDADESRLRNRVGGSPVAAVQSEALGVILGIVRSIATDMPRAQPASPSIMKMAASGALLCSGMS